MKTTEEEKKKINIERMESSYTEGYKRLEGRNLGRKEEYLNVKIPLNAIKTIARLRLAEKKTLYHKEKHTRKQRRKRIMRIAQQVQRGECKAHVIRISPIRTVIGGASEGKSNDERIPDSEIRERSTRTILRCLKAIKLRAFFSNFDKELHTYVHTYIFKKKGSIKNKKETKRFLIRRPNLANK